MAKEQRQHLVRRRHHASKRDAVEGAQHVDNARCLAAVVHGVSREQTLHEQCLCSHGDVLHNADQQLIHGLRQRRGVHQCEQEQTPCQRRLLRHALCHLYSCFLGRGGVGAVAGQGGHETGEGDGRKGVVGATEEEEKLLAGDAALAKKGRRERRRVEREKRERAKKGNLGVVGERRKGDGGSVKGEKEGEEEKGGKRGDGRDLRDSGERIGGECCQCAEGEVEEKAARQQRHKETVGEEGGGCGVCCCGGFIGDRFINNTVGDRFIDGSFTGGSLKSGENRFNPMIGSIDGVGSAGEEKRSESGEKRG